MTDVFISYSRKDRGRAEVMAKALTARGLDVWWDTHLKTGAEFRHEIAQKLEAARAVIVIWSEDSVASRFVCDEADVGAQQDTLFPVLVDMVDIPLGFRQIQTADLTRWRGKARDRQLLAFLDIIEGVAKGRKHLGGSAPAVRQDEGGAPEPVAPVPVPERAPKPKRQKTVKASRSLMITGQRARLALIVRSLVLAVLVAGAFGALARVTHFILPDYHLHLMGVMGVLVFVTRYITFQADRKSRGASLRLLSRSYTALFFFALIATAPFMLEGRIYAAMMEAVRIEGIEGADINAAAFDGEGNRLATASDDHSVRVWDAATGVQLATFRGHEDNVWSARFSPQGTHVVSASRDLTARVWLAATGEELFVLKGHRATVRDALYDPRGRYIATASSDGTIKIWDPKTGKELRVLKGHSGRVSALAVSRDGALLASSSYDGTVRVWRPGNGSLVRIFTGQGSLNDVAFSGDGRKLAAASEQGSVYVWEVSTAKRLANMTGHGKMFGVRFVNQGRSIASVGIDGVVRMRNISSGALETEFPGHLDGARGLDVSGDGVLLVSGSRDNTARVWDVASGRQIQIMGHITPAVDLPRAIDLPPWFAASRAPVPVDLVAEPDIARGYLVKGMGLAGAVLLAGLVLRTLLRLMRQTGLARRAVVSPLAITALYIAALMLSAFPAEATFLWLTFAFVPMTVLAAGRWIVSSATGGRL